MLRVARREPHVTAVEKVMARPVLLSPLAVPGRVFGGAFTGEDRLLREYRVSYLLTGTKHAEQIGLKLGSATVGATLEFELDGSRLYKIGGL